MSKQVEMTKNPEKKQPETNQPSIDPSENYLKDIQGLTEDEIKNRINILTTNRRAMQSDFNKVKNDM